MRLHFPLSILLAVGSVNAANGDESSLRGKQLEKDAGAKHGSQGQDQQRKLALSNDESVRIKSAYLLNKDDAPLPVQYVSSSGIVTATNGRNKHINLIAPPHDESEVGDRLLQASSVQRLDPLDGDTIGADHSFQALASDAQGVRRVVFRIRFPDGVTTSDFDASSVSSGVYQVNLSGFTDGSWAWQVWVLDQSGNWAFTTFQPFTVNVDGGGGGDGKIVAGLQPPCIINQDSIYNICLDLEGPSGAFEPWMGDFGEAVARWESVIVGDIPSIASSSLSIATTCTQYPSTIDDLYICGVSDFIDGQGGILGSASPLFIRTSSGLPITGEMTFDTPDIDSLRADGTFLGVVLHELGHVLGLGALWTNAGLYDGFSGQYRSGTRAESEWRNIGCSGPLPVELEGGPGTAGAHWDEDCLVNELMTGFRTGGTPLSRITIGSLFDLGYTVNFEAADPFTVADLGSCGSFCPAAGHRHLRKTDQLISPKMGAIDRKLSDEGMAIMKEYAKVKLAKMKSAAPMDLPDGVEYVGDKFIDIIYEENGNIHAIHFSSDDVSD